MLIGVENLDGMEGSSCQADFKVLIVFVEIISLGKLLGRLITYCVQEFDQTFNLACDFTWCW